MAMSKAEVRDLSNNLCKKATRIGERHRQMALQSVIANGHYGDRQTVLYWEVVLFWWPVARAALLEQIQEVTRLRRQAGIEPYAEGSPPFEVESAIRIRYLDAVI